VKKIVAIFLTFQLLILSLGGITATLSFTLNKAYIIKELCVQKDAEVNTCLGQCHLKKSLQQQAEDDAALTQTFEWMLTPFSLPNEDADNGHIASQLLENVYAPYCPFSSVFFIEPATPPPSFSV